MANPDQNNEDDNQKDEPPVKADVIRDFVEVQKEELEVRQQEVDQQEKEAEFNYEYSIKALEAQERDLAHERENNQRALNKVFIFVGVIVLMLLLFLGYLVYSDNPELVMEILKALGYIGAGGAGGYGLGYKKAFKSTTPKE